MYATIKSRIESRQMSAKQEIIIKKFAIEGKLEIVAPAKPTIFFIKNGLRNASVRKKKYINAKIVAKKCIQCDV